MTDIVMDEQQRMREDYEIGALRQKLAAMECNRTQRWIFLASELGEKLAKAEADLARCRAALELIAAPMRPDGTWNRCREACRQLAVDALKGEKP